jgi:hypothetical protein
MACQQLLQARKKYVRYIYIYIYIYIDGSRTGSGLLVARQQLPEAGGGPRLHLAAQQLACSACGRLDESMARG